MTEDYFWAITLDKTSPKVTWDPENRNDDHNEGAENMRGEHTLILKQAVVGADSKDDQTVVEVEVVGYKNDVKIPIVNLKSQNPSTVLDMLFPDPPVTFHLTRGDGPVHLIGNHTVGTGELVGDEDEDEDLEDEMDEEDLEEMEDERNHHEDKKRKGAQNMNNMRGGPGKGKKPKLEDK